jgi:hypothetical protein
MKKSLKKLALLIASSVLMALCEDTFEIGYDMLWQGEPEAA